MKNVDISNSQVSILIEIDGVVHLVGMEKDYYEAVSEVVKRSIATVIPTNKTQHELRKFFSIDDSVI